jgi:four helix bundle protein
MLQHAMTVPESFQARSFQFALKILKFYKYLKRDTDVPVHLANQVLRAGTSIGANLSEAKSAYSRRDLASKHTIALRESRECRFWLRLIAADQPSVSRFAKPLTDECTEFVAMLTASVKKLKRSPVDDSEEK